MAAVYASAMKAVNTRAIMMAAVYARAIVAAVYIGAIGWSGSWAGASGQGSGAGTGPE